MPYSKYRPELMGHATLTPTGRFEAGSFQSFTLTYTAGRFGIDDLGGLQVAFRVNTDLSPLQFDDPKAPGYTTLEASNGAALAHKWEVRRNFRPFAKALYVQTKRFLDPGDTITIRFGDPRQGSPGLRMQTFCEDRLLFKVIVDAFGTQNYVELPDVPAIEVVSGPPVSWKAVLPTLRRVGEPFRLGLKAEDRWGNPSDRIDTTVRLQPSLPVTGLPESVTFRPGQFTSVFEDLSVDQTGDLVIDVLATDGSRLAQSNPMRVEMDPPLLHFWADLHGQSEETVGTNTARRYFAFARDKGFADACCHQGNDFQITPAFWDELNALTAEFDQPGRFVAVPGYEWSGNTSVGGDRNVLYRHEGRPIYRSSHALLDDDMADEPTDAHTITDLMAKLDGEDVVVLAHVGGRYADVTYQTDGAFAHDGRLETAVEVHSAWGSFEWILNDAFACGFRVGVVANSDGHKGRPSASHPGAATFGSYGGLTCYLMPSLDRDALFEALRRRHHYGTSGDRLYLHTAVSLERDGDLYARDPAVESGPSRPTRQAIMGDIVRTDDDHALLSVDVLANAPIERLEIRDGLDLIETVRPYGEADLGPRIRVIWEGAEYRGRGRAVNWDGTAVCDGNRILRTRKINVWNVDRRFEQTGPDRLAWQAISTGSFGGFDAWLEDGSAGVLRIDTAHVRTEIPIAEIGFEDRVFDAGGLGRRLRVFRLPEDNPHRTLTVERRLPLRPSGDTRFYVCLTQENGHQAWSSPIYLIR